MPNPEQLELLRQGVEAWNEWRRDNPAVEIDLSGADLSGDNLSRANLLEAKLVGANLILANLIEANLNRVDLKGANLIEAVLIGANLIDANLNGAYLCRANLGQVQAFHTDFTGAELTGACIEDWSINVQTKLDDVECDYVYLKYPEQMRCPSDPNRNFEPGEFTKLFQKVLSTVDLIFRNGVDWQALLISLEKLRVEAGGAELSIQAIENKNDGAFVVRVNVPTEADKAEAEKFLKQEYESALKTLEAKYEKQFQGEQLKLYREEMVAKQQVNTQLMGVIKVVAEHQASKIQDMMTSQDLIQAAQQIQEVLTRLQNNGVPVEKAQEQVANDLAIQAKSDPAVMNKLVDWGQILAIKAGETTISEVVKAVVPLALKLLGIPL